MSNFINYIKETKAELAHVSWPSRSQTISLTIVVIVISVATAIFLSLFDRGFTSLIVKLLPF